MAKKPAIADNQELKENMKEKAEPDSNEKANVKLEVPNESATTTQCKKAKAFLREDIDLKCLLLADADTDCAPLHFRQLFMHYDTATLTQAELLFLLVYIVAIESGYITQIEYANMKNLIQVKPNSSFHAKNVLQIVSVPPTYGWSSDKCYFSMHLRTIINTNIEQTDAMNSLLTALVTGDFMICTLTPDRSTDVRGDSICLSIGRYVLNNQPKDKPLQYRFRKLNELSKLMRNKLFVPVRNRQLALIDDVIVYPAFDALPTELYDFIFKYLSQNQLKVIAITCKRLNFLYADSKYCKNRTL